VADHLVANRIWVFLNFREDAKLSVFKGLQNLNRRRFKDIEDAPLAAYAAPCRR
jgi:hypothetical protein